MSPLPSLRELSLVGGLPVWAVLLGLLGTAALATWYARSLRRHLSGARALLLATLRGVALAGLLALGLNPVWTVRSFQSVRAPVAVILDDSRSMQLTDGPEGASRFAEANGLLASASGSLLEALSRDYEVRLYTLHAPARLGTAELQAVTPAGRSTPLAAAFVRATNDVPAAPPVALVLLSDGRVESPDELLRTARSLNLPVYTVSVGNPARFRDIFLTELRAPALAFRDKPVTIEAQVRAYGYAGLTVPVSLRRGGRVVRTTQVQLAEAGAPRPISFTLTPEELGDQHYTLEVPPQAGERLTANNTLEVTFQVARDKIRVLTISGTPNWNYRFLRAALKRDPSVDLISFIILRTPSDVINVPQNELSLIPFPVETIFGRELRTFDLLVFDDFSYRSYFSWAYLENIREFVRQGGAFAMLGGSRAFEDGGYAESPLEEVLPVALGKEPSYRYLPAGTLRLTRAGQRHPVSRLAPTPEANQQAWAAMPYPEAANLLRPKAQATTLLELEPGRPLLAVGSFGKGRTLALGTDQAWRWSLEVVGQKRDNLPYLTFAQQLVRWLVQDPSLQPVQLIPPATLRAGEVAEVRVRVLDEDYQPAARASVQVTVQSPSGARQVLRGVPTGGRGEFRVALTPEEEGAYVLTADARDAGKALGGSRRLVAAQPATGAELRDAAPDPALLLRLAQSTGGIGVPAARAATEVPRALRAIARRPEAKLTEEREIRLLGMTIPFLLLTTLLAAEWFMRRRWGLV
ncbi:MAG: hypothetical protein HYV08_12765 [Deltaproteobacteria bacterium]|nr:hypothetical protein [Deltaproteobacteria bacterium]